MRKIWTIILLAALMSGGCGQSIDPAAIPGKYFYNGDQDDQLEIYPDKHYRHVIYGEGEPSVRTGSWEIQSSKIVLHNFRLEGGRFVGDFTSTIKIIDGRMCLDYQDGQTYFRKNH